MSMGWAKHSQEQNRPESFVAEPVRETSAKNIATESVSNPSNIEEQFSAEADDFETSLKGKVILMVVVVGVIAAAAVSGIWFLLKTWSHKPNSNQPPVTEVTEQRSGNLISAVNGGRIVYYDPEDNSSAEIVVPPGALSSDTELGITKVSSGTVTNMYHLTPEGLNFLKPVTVVIPYKETGLQEGESPHDIQLEYWFTNAQMKRRLSFIVDTHDKKLRAQVSAL